MAKIKCIRDKFGGLIPIDKIEYIDKDYWVHAGGCRRDLRYEEYVKLLRYFEKVENND